MSISEKFGDIKSIDAKLYRRRGTLGLKDSIAFALKDSYDSDTGELWGRDALRWGQLILFYICFYVCLGLFYAGLWLLWTLVILDTDSPLYSGPDDGMAWTPGVSHIPILDPDRRSALIHYSRANDTQVGQIKEDMYNNFLKYYERQYWSSENGNFIDCTDGRANTEQGSDIEKVCEFRLDNIRPCIYEDDYGWGDGQPCIILKLNRVNNWVPENYKSIDEVPDEIKDIWREDRIAVKCYGEDPISRESLGEIAYYPYQGWSFDYFPFTGQQGYKSPLVAAQFLELPRRVLLFITCKAYTRNMIYDSNYRLGMTRFEILSD